MVSTEEDRETKARALGGDDFCITLFFFFLEDREQCDRSDTTDDSDNLNWVKVLDRWVSFTAAWSSLIKFLCAMEVVVNGEMIRGNEAARKVGFKEKLAFEVHQDEDVLFWWSKLCDFANVESVCSKALVHYVVDHYVVIQGLQGGWRYLRKAANRIFVVQRRT